MVCSLDRSGSLLLVSTSFTMTNTGHRSGAGAQPRSRHPLRILLSRMLRKKK